MKYCPGLFRALAMLCISCGVIACSGSMPKIESIYPRLGAVGSNLQISGKNFGEEQDESFVAFGSVIPTFSSYRLWSNELIVVRIPDFAESSLITVQRGKHRSNGVLFSMLDAMPVIIPAQNTIPVISTVEPAHTNAGKIIEISGAGFGDLREKSAVYFNWDVELSNQLSGTEILIPADELESAYEYWNDRAIRVRVPDGTGSGYVRVGTEGGVSNVMPITITGKPGSRVLKAKKNYSISYSVDIQVEEAAIPNAIFLWLPVPGSAFSQQNRGLLEESTPSFIKNFRGSSLYQFSDLTAGLSRKVAVSYLVEVYAVESTIQPAQVRAVQDAFILKNFTAPSALIPSDNEAVRSRAALITGREQNPYLKARAIYRELLKEERDEETAAALSFCALSRAAGVPAMPVAGVLVNKIRQTTPHIWAQFYLEGFGWVPVDIALGQGSAPDNFALPAAPADFYFGNLDNSRIAFSYNETQLSNMDAGGSISGYNGDYALQNIWEESSGGLKAYSSFWSEISVTGIY